MSISIIQTADIPAISNLVNSAYRGDASKKGWTTEADLLQGELRTDAAAIELLLTDPNNTILKFTLPDNSIAGCVYLQQQDKKLYLGMLSVNPELQSAGIGKQLLKAAEQHALEISCSSIVMTVISVRKELVTWYERHGYQKTGETKPFIVDEKFGIPSQELIFEVLEKKLFW